MCLLQVGALLLKRTLGTLGLRHLPPKPRCLLIQCSSDQACFILGRLTHREN